MIPARSVEPEDLVERRRPALRHALLEELRHRVLPARADLLRRQITLGSLEIGHSTSPLGSGGMRSKVVAAEMATAAGIPAVICNGLRPGAVRGFVLNDVMSDCTLQC